MIMRLFGLLAVLGLISSVTTGALAQSSPATKVPKKVTVRYLCDGLRVTAVYDNVKNRVSFVWGAKDQHLPHVLSADGARYANSKLEWWEKGDQVTLSALPEHNVLTTCTVRDKARGR
ncbi:MAG TPA: MliC family protein [Candidatus Lustribacter sp.]